MTKSQARQLELRSILSAQEIMAKYREAPTMVRAQQDGREIRDDRGPKGPSDVAGSADMVAEVSKEIASDWRYNAFMPRFGFQLDTPPQHMNPSDIPVGLVAYDLR